VIVVDANLLLHSYDQLSAQHERARQWLTGIMAGNDLVGLPWQSVAVFLRITTHPRVGGGRVSLERAAAIVDTWMEQPQVRLLVPGDRHWTILRRLLTEGQARGALVTDAQLAALTIENGGVLHTTFSASSLDESDDVIRETECGARPELPAARLGARGQGWPMVR
jgi:hypothetical protein